MKETFETILTIAKWSEETFGDNITLEGQVTKFYDELNEWLATDRTDITELADLAIVASSVARFSVVKAASYFCLVAFNLMVSKFTEEDLEEAINKKMAINRKRKWSVGKGNFQHITENKE